MTNRIFQYDYKALEKERKINCKDTKACVCLDPTFRKISTTTLGEEKVKIQTDINSLIPSLFILASCECTYLYLQHICTCLMVKH